MFSTKVGIPFTDLADRAIRPGWTATRIRLRVLTIQRQHLDYYLDEFTFRFNRRRSNVRGLLFHRLAEQAVAVGPAPYRAIIGKPAEPGESAGSGQ